MKKIIKSMVIGFFFILVLPFGLLAKIQYKLFGSQMFFAMFGEAFALLPSFFGYFSRACYYKITLKKSHLDLYVAFGSLITKIDTEIGKTVGIGGRTTVGLVSIGDYTILANYVSILSGSKQHNFDNPDENVVGKVNNFEKMMIGANVFIGDQSVIMANIGDKSIIGAGSIVVKDIPPYSIAVGNPAKVVKERPRT